MRRLTIFFRWLARVVCTVAEIGFLVAVIGGMIEGDEGYKMIGIAVGAIGFVLLIGVVLAWFRERAGGVFLVLSSVIMSAFIALTAGSNILLASLAIPSPFFISGVIFFFLDNRGRGTRDY